jgi:hypothetical protein
MFALLVPPWSSKYGVRELRAMRVHALGPALLALPLLAGCLAEPVRLAAEGETAFRVRSDFSAPLNDDRGWAGALNENVTIAADRPFRLRFEVERGPGSSPAAQFRLQFRRNGGDWADVEAHDFPYPVREIELDFEDETIGTKPVGWSVAAGSAGDFAVVADGKGKILRARAAERPLTALRTPPWEATEFAASFRLPAENRSGFGLVFGYVDASNHCRVFLDPAAGAIRVSRFADGKETVVAERKAGITPGRWLDLELQILGGEVQVNFDNDALEFAARLEAAVPPKSLGFHVPARGAVAFREFAVAGEARTPRVSIVSSPAFQNGAPTTDLLRGASTRFQPGAGMSLTERTPPWPGAAAHGEFEWAIVVRRYADGAVTNDEGDTFELRMVEADGARPITSRNPLLRLTIPPGHVGGTYVEAPGRIGPWQASNGDLYFIMEPTETDNVFMMVKSADGGRTWREIDGANRPQTDDLESVDARLVGDTIHMIHQVTNSTRYHTFQTSDHPTQPDTWAIRDEVAARARSIAQAAAVAMRSAGSIVAFYVADTVHYSIRSAAGTWAADTALDPRVAPRSAGPKAVLGADGVVHVAYYGMDGTIWYRRMLPDGTFTARQQLATGLRQTRAEYGAVLPLVFVPETNTLVIIYRQSDRRLWERRVVNYGPPTPAVPVTDRAVIQDAVDSQQPAADACADGATVHVLFVDESTGSLFSTHDSGLRQWQPPKQEVGGIQGSWVRGTTYTRPDGARVYGFVYDAGSKGGAGMNRFAEVVVNRP